MRAGAGSAYIGSSHERRVCLVCEFNGVIPFRNDNLFLCNGLGFGAGLSGYLLGEIHWRRDFRSVIWCLIFQHFLMARTIRPRIASVQSLLA